ncbi:hypothetical protein [Devosia sp. XK-2]|uniref:hypothetical protein n=1 Tax=Devosia sp. XK-2 TaxID=3126689 RepID=UPI0030D4FD49
MQVIEADMDLMHTLDANDIGDIGGRPGGFKKQADPDPAVNKGAELLNLLCRTEHRKHQNICPKIDRALDLVTASDVQRVEADHQILVGNGSANPCNIIKCVAADYGGQVSLPLDLAEQFEIDHHPLNPAVGHVCSQFGHISDEN